MLRSSEQKPQRTFAAIATVVLASVSVLGPAGGCAGDAGTTSIPSRPGTTAAGTGAAPGAKGGTGGKTGGAAGTTTGGAAGKTTGGAAGKTTGGAAGKATGGAAGKVTGGGTSAGGAAASGPDASMCGDGVCDHDVDEVCETCPADCGACAVCGNGTCEKGTAEESCESCAQDCGTCLVCGDGTCSPLSGEDCTTCVADCGKCEGCGDGTCSEDETCASCPGDCGACKPCGNGKCDAGETCKTCEDDCGACETEKCGDGDCDGKETCTTCAQDCGKCERLGCVQGDFKVYYGGLHAHTHISDGKGSPAEAFAHASTTTPALDFLWLSDHHSSVTPTEYKGCQVAADKFNKPGKFVTGCGYEKTMFDEQKNGLGHFNALFPDKLLKLSYNIPGIYNEIAECGPCLGQFNHPPWPGDFRDYKYYPVAKDKVRLIEFNGKGAWDAKLKAYFTALDNGWMVSPSYNEDNHRGGWGDTSNATMIWAPTLSRASVRTAVKAHRTLATNDDTSSMKMMADDECWMGSVLKGLGKSKITITLADKQKSDGFGVVTLYGPNRKKIDTRDCKDENPCTVNFPLDVKEKTYFVAIVHQKDGDVIVSAPIWYVP